MHARKLPNVYPVKNISKPKITSLKGRGRYSISFLGSCMSVEVRSVVGVAP